MLFNSVKFIVFFPIVVCFYFALPHRFRWCILLIASYYFYMCWKTEYAILIMASTASVYFAAIQIEKQKKQLHKKIYFISGLFINLGILFLFKYFNFLNDIFSSFFNIFNINYNVHALRFLLPVGISFYTFQSIGYLLDVYRGGAKAEKHFGVFALYVSFFPQLVAGPIERSTKLLPQFFEKHKFEYQRVRAGIRLMFWGFFKKVVVADGLAIYVDAIYNNQSHYEGVTLILATFIFAFQLYCDFSAYSDIAIGAANVMGFELMVNFKRPYLSKSISEFWRRWHISLSTWIRDYLYTPIVMKRRIWGNWSIYYALMVSFILCGLWHGADWKYIIFGFFHGLALSLDALTKNNRKEFAKFIPTNIYNTISLLFTFCFINFTYIFFRSNSVSDAFNIVGKIISSIVTGDLFSSLGVIYSTVPQLNKYMLLILLILIVDIIQEKYKRLSNIVHYPVIVRYPLYSIVFYLLVFHGAESSSFVYFQF